MSNTMRLLDEDVTSRLLDDLRAARAVIDSPEKWTKGHYYDQYTGRFCAIGACYKGIGAPIDQPYGLDDQVDWMTPFYDRVDDLRSALGEAFTPDDRATYYRGVVSFNDAEDTTHADVLALFDRAIAAVEARMGVTV